MDIDLENGFDEFIKEFENIPSENVIGELEELGVTFIHDKSVKSSHEEKQSIINTQVKETDIS